MIEPLDFKSQEEAEAFVLEQRKFKPTLICKNEFSQTALTAALNKHHEYVYDIRKYNVIPLVGIASKDWLISTD